MPAPGSRWEGVLDMKGKLPEQARRGGGLDMAEGKLPGRLPGTLVSAAEYIGGTLKGSVWLKCNPCAT